MPTEETVHSPRMDTLQRELNASNDTALNEFWTEMTERKAPLIEAIENDDHHSLVTFLWRSGEDSENVEVVSNLSGRNASEPMDHLPGADLLYKTYRVHNQTRDSYQFAIAGDNVTDPLNPLQHVFPDDEETGFTGWVSSVLEMPAAPPHPWSTARHGVPQGHVMLHRIRSEALDHEYRVWVYTPPGYTTERAPYGYLLAFDGWFYVNLIPTPTILDNLLADGLLPALVAIMVGDFGETRMRDLACYPPFADFLTKQLLPWAQQNYHLADDPEQSAVVGGSRGGLMAAYMGLIHSEIFGNVISQSGAVGWMPEDDHEADWLARQYAVYPKLPLQFYLDAGTFETEIGIAGRGIVSNLLTDNRHMRTVLQAKGYSVHYSEFHGGHNPMNWQGTLANALQALLGKSTSDADG